jgi:hypothetical protein
MSLNLVAGVEVPSRLPTATSPLFLLGLDSAGHWVVRETTGTKGWPVRHGDRNRSIEATKL